MSKARLVVTAVLVEGRPKAEVARTYGISRTWVHELVTRYQAEGDAGLEPRSRRPRSNPGKTPRAVEDDIVALRKQLLDDGLDAGAHTIAAHLHRRHGTAPSVATIWRILTRRGFVTPTPAPAPSRCHQAASPGHWAARVAHSRCDT
jgi:transposase